MHKPSFDGLNGNIPADGPPAASTNVSEGPAVNFANFEFKKIGQPPVLLQRLSETGPDINMSHEYNEGSRSPSPDLEDELLISESTPDAMNPGRPLIARIAMSEPTNGATDNMDVEEPTSHRCDSRTTVTPSQFNNRGSSGSTAGGHPQPSFSNVTITSDLAKYKKASVISHTNVNSNSLPPVSSSSKNPGHAYQASNISQEPASVASSTSNNLVLNPNVNADPLSPVQPVSAKSQLPLPAHGTPMNGAATSSESSGVPSLRDLLNQLSSTFLNIHPINSANVLQLAESSKVQCSELSSSLRKVSKLAQQCSEATQHCMRLVETFQNQFDTFSSAVEKLDLGRDKQWIDNVKALVSQMDLRIKIDEQETREAESRREQKRQEADRMQSSSIGTSPSDFTGPRRPNVTESAPLNGIRGMDSNTALSDVKVQYDQDVNRLTEELAAVAARKKVIEEEKIRDQAVVHELAAQLAQAQVKQNASEELLRAEDENTKRKEEELGQKKAETERLLLQAAQEAAEKEKKEAEKASRKALLEEKLAAEREERDRRARMEEQERKRSEEEETIARQMARQDALREQEKKRQEVAAKKQHALKQNAKVAVAHKRNKASQESASQTRLSNHSTAPSSGTRVSASSIEPASTNLAPQITAVKSGAQVSRNNGAQNMHHTGLSTDKAPFPAPTLSTNAPLIEQLVIPSQSQSTLNVPRNGSGNNPPIMQSSSGLPSPPSEAIQTNSATAHTPTPGIRKNVAAGWRGQESMKPSQIKTPPAHANLPVKPSGLPSAFEHHDISVHRQGQDAGNLPVFPRSHISPISPDAQKADLRSLSEHHGIGKRQETSIKPDPDERKPMAKTERGLSLQKSAPTSIDSKSAIQTDSLSRKVKIETIDDTDIPRLSMPPSPTTPKFNLDESLPTFETAASSSHIASQPALPSSSRYLQATPTISSKVARQDVQTKPSTTVSSGSHSTQNSASRVPANHAIPLPQVAHCHIATNDFFNDADFRMGPEIAPLSGVWDQPLRLSPVEANSLGSRRQDKPHAPQNIDHYSPSPPPGSRTPHGNPPRPRQVINRRGDHYSPPRSPENFSGPSCSRRPGGANNSRGVSPVRQGQNARRNNGPSLTSEPNAQPGRKRLRDDQDHGGPPLRRQRFTENDRTTERYDSMSQHTLALCHQSNPQGEDWSHVANYAPSPSPEPSRPAALSSRMEANEVDQGRSGYRGNGGHPNMAQRRQPNEYVSTSAQNQSSNFGNHGYTSTSYQRQNHRESNNDSQPYLLSRFTDQRGMSTPPSEPAQHYSAPQHRPARGRPHKQLNPRANHHHPSLEQRMNTNHKGSLINRIEQGPPVYE